MSCLIGKLCISCQSATGSGAAQSTDPPSGSVIPNFEGPDNTTTITCNIATNQGVQIGTQWNIENFGGNPVLQSVNVAPDLFDIGGDLRPGSTTDTFLNQITILNFTSELDNAILYCGTGVDRQQANFTIRIYRKVLHKR